MMNDQWSIDNGKRRAEDSNLEALAGASFQDWCNSRSASSPISFCMSFFIDARTQVQ